MGLDITAYSHLKSIGKHAEDCEEYDHIRAYTYDSFPRSFRGIPVLDTTTITGWGGTTTFLEGGCYLRTEQTEEFHFRAGSYGGYGQWRDDLRLQFNPNQDPDQPFYELIWFADNEGSIGPEAAADLLADFREHADKYAAGEFDGAWWAKYRDWTRACELAAANGLIHFH